MAIITQAPRGTEDVLPAEAVNWQIIEGVMRSEAALHGFGEVRTPVFEHTELFQRGVGDTTDIVQKEMYTFLDKGGRSVTLRPEGTAGAARAMLEHGVYNDGLPVRFYYLTSCYRYEKAQKGRLREFHQFGAEMYGSADPLADAEVILLGSSIFERFGLAGCERKWPSELSGGMRQRAAFLRTYLMGADVTLLDEPFSALDALTRTDVRRWFVDVAAELGLSALVITHDVDEAVSMASRIYVLAGAPAAGEPSHVVGIVTVDRVTSESFELTDEYLAAKREVMALLG